jgi:hypothetical protein
LAHIRDTHHNTADVTRMHTSAIRLGTCVCPYAYMTECRAQTELAFFEIVLTSA